MSKSIRETHLEYVQALRDRGEAVLQPKIRKPFGRIDGYVKSHVPHIHVGAIFQDDEGTFGLRGDMGVVYVIGIKWEDLGLCDAYCWYEWTYLSNHSARVEAMR